MRISWVIQDTLTWCITVQLTDISLDLEDNGTYKFP